MYRLFLTIRYLWSRPFSWVAMIGIWLTVAALICTVAIMSGFLREMEVMIRGTTADIILTPQPDVRPEDNLLVQPPPMALIERALKTVPGIEGISPHILRPALMATSGETLDIARLTPDDTDVTEVIGIDVEREVQVTGFTSFLHQTVEQGDRVNDPKHPFHWDHGDDEPLPVAVLGEGLLQKHGLRKGDTFTLVTLPETVTLESASARAQKFRVGGSLRTGHYKHDLISVFMTLDAARDFAKTDQDATEICVRAGTGVELDALARQIRSRLAQVGMKIKVETWRERHRNYLSSVENQRSILGFLLAFFVIVACFNIFAALTILVSDKTRDIGILGAMGATRNGIAGLFVTCSAVLTLIGASVGCVSGVVLARNINLVHEGIEALFGIRIFRPDIYLLDRIPTEVQAWFVALVFGVTLVLAVLCALLPALRAARMDQVRALRYQ